MHSSGAVYSNLSIFSPSGVTSRSQVVVGSTLGMEVEISWIVQMSILLLFNCSDVLLFNWLSTVLSPAQ